LQRVNHMVKDFEPQRDYATVATWWEKHGWGVLPEDMLPDAGYVVEMEVDGKMEAAVAGWLYETDSKICLLEWVVGDPDLPSKTRRRAVNILVEKLVDKAKDLGYKVIFTICKHPRLMKTYSEHGFITGDSGMTTFVRRLD